jgi:uncharacterized protein (DUF1800 family)
MPRRRLLVSLVLFCVALAAAGCAAGSNTSAMTLVTGPLTDTVRAGDPAVQFSAMLNGTPTSAVTWSVGGVVGGNSAVGTISTSGLFTPPSAVPNPNVETVQAISTSNSSVMGQSTVTLQNPIPVVVSISPTTLALGPFTLIVTGSKFASGAQVMFGGIALATQVTSATELTASGMASMAHAGSVVVTVENPDPGAIVSTTSKTAQVVTGQAETASAAVRFLEQSTFGPTPTAMTQLEGTGFTSFLTDQFAANVSTFPDPSATDIMNNNLVPTQHTLFTNALVNPDQLRQRVALALSEIWVTSGNTIPVQGMAPYMRLLSQDAFANYRTIMYDVTLSPAMGRYLDMVNNDKPNTTAGTHANENYARELMQLFTLGLDQLNENGTLKVDSGGNPIPTYDQNTVEAVARAFTGWTYAPIPPANTTPPHNPPYYLVPMVAVDSNHDMAAKAILGTTLPANQTAAQDLGGTSTNSNGALDVIFANASLPPFVCKQLIQHLVTSNPSAAYVKRVADVFVSGTFANFGTGQRGDMQAVIAAILLDPEARRGDIPANAVATDGHLREPILYAANIARAFGTTSDGAALVNFANGVSEPPLRSPSVFNFFPPDFAIPGTNPVLLGPEFNLQTTATAFLRINFAYQFAFTTITGTTVDFTSYANLASSPNASGQLLDTLNTLLLHGAMSSSTRASILTAVNAVPAGAAQNLTRAKTAIYLILSSSQYQVEY